MIHVLRRRKDRKLYENDFFGKFYYWKIFKRLFLVILYRTVFGVAYYKFKDRFTKLKITDPKCWIRST